jgi:hypothetical protein
MPLPRSARSSLSALLGLLIAVATHAQSKCPTQGDCLEPHGGPGCADQACCESICAFDPFCCGEWDATCVTAADNLCAGLCGASASGSCFAAHPNPSCDDADCCSLVCELDPFCCLSAWDGNCVFYAGFSCSTGGGDCGSPQAGDCLQANGTPACDDAACCEAVCSIDPRCCEIVWDSICAAVAQTTCVGGCEVEAPANAYLETETCDQPSNDPCHGQTAEPLGESRSIAGSFRETHDVDVFEIDLAAIDADGDGQIRMRLLMTTEVAATLSIGPADCDLEATFSEVVPKCVDRSIETCVPAGLVWIALETNESSPPCDGVSYKFTFEVRDTCDDPCGSGGDCLEPHLTAGCDDATCCAAVCDIDPACCEWEWDGSCAMIAAETCGGTPPINDDCTDAIAVGIGSTPFRELLATLDGPADWCGPADMATRDVWFAHQVACTGSLYVGTCGTADFDTVIEVYRGDCDAGLESIGCVDDSFGCPEGTSLIEVLDAVCGETLLIRVLDTQWPGGNGELILDCFGDTCACAGDLDGDDQVGGSDLGLLFVQWGPCRGDCAADLDGNGTVGGSDLGLLFAAWGDC